MIVNLPKECVRLLKWLDKAASGDEGRPALQGVRVDKADPKGAVLVACDGYVLIAAPLPEVIAEAGVPEDRTLPVRLAGQAWAIPDDIEPTGYPAWRNVIPSGTSPVLRVNPKLMIAALSGFDAPVTVHTGTGGAIELTGRTPDGSPAYALVMPMMSDKTDPWRPNPNPTAK